MSLGSGQALILDSNSANFNDQLRDTKTYYGAVQRPNDSFMPSYRVKSIAELSALPAPTGSNVSNAGGGVKLVWLPVQLVDAVPPS